ncbi:MAG: hypothetical protein R3B89_05435 [Polyangiaceae bacterium]
MATLLGPVGVLGRVARRVRAVPLVLGQLAVLVVWRLEGRPELLGAARAVLR